MRLSFPRTRLIVGGTLAAWASSLLFAQSPPDPGPSPNPTRIDGTGRSGDHGAPGESREVARHQERRRRGARFDQCSELGRFPDADVADSLAICPASPSSAPPAARASGSPCAAWPEYNIVTLNNRILASDDDGRDLAFDVLPAELISGADVLKSAAGLRGRGQHRRHGQPAHRQRLRQSGPAWRRARRGQLQRHVAPAGQQVLGVRRPTPTPTTRSASCSAACTRTTRRAPIR